MTLDPLDPLDPESLPAPIDVSDNSAALAQVDDVIARGPYEATWESLSQHDTPKWYGEAKFGIFLHWGGFSVPAFESEWYPRQMYREGTASFSHHVATYGAQSRFGYKDFLPHFRMEDFEAGAWAALFKRSGAQYVVPVAEHHDGYAMYATRRSRWNVVDIGPHRDVMGELLSAVDESWLIRGASSHRAEHWFFMNGGMAFDSDVRDPRYEDLYGPALRKEIDPTERFLEDWLLRTVEVIDEYRPQLLYFDTGIEESSFDPYLRRLAAYYYNRAAQWGRDVVINYKWDAFAEGAGVLTIERGTMGGIRPAVWQNDTAVSHSSWGWVEGQEYKTPESLIAELADVVSKNGNLLLNIGPRPDGTIAEPEIEILEAIGDWLAINGEAIYGTAPWVVFGEGPTLTPAGAFADVKDMRYGAQDFRFTTMSEVGHDYVYAIAMTNYVGASVRITSFGKASPMLGRPIIDVRVLGAPGAVAWERSDDALVVSVPERPSGRAGGPVVRVELAKEPAEGSARIDFFHGLGI